MAANITVETTKQRQLNLLRGLAEKAQWRHDITLPLNEVTPTLDFEPNFGDGRFVDKANRQFQGGSELAYDFNTIREEKLIKIAFMTQKPTEYGDLKCSDPAIMLTPNGLAAVRQLENRPPPDYWKKAEVWFRSKWWSVPVLLICIGIPWCVGMIDGIKAIFKWFGVGK